MRLDVQRKCESVKRSKSVQRSASINGACGDEYK